ncbi:MAG: hypothetical protein ACKVS8_00160 [Phycisphaerales bacterium]
MAQAPPSQPESAQIARGEDELEAQVGALLATVAATTGEIEDVMSEAERETPVEPGLDDQVRGALAGRGPVATDPPAESASIGPEIGAIDVSLAAKVQAELDEFRDPAQEMAEADALMRQVRMQDAPAAADDLAPADDQPFAAGGAQGSMAPVGAPRVEASPAASEAASAPEPAAPDPPRASVPEPSMPVAEPAPSVAVREARPAAKVATVAAAASEPVVQSAAAVRGPSRVQRVIVSFEEAVEPLALRLGSLPAILRQTLGWVGVLTLFNAGVVWVWVLFVAPRADLVDVDPRSFLAAPEVKGEHGEAKKDAGHGEKKDAAKDGHGAEKKAAAKKAEKKKDDHGEKKDAQAKGKDAKGGKKQASAGGH